MTQPPFMPDPQQHPYQAVSPGPYAPGGPVHPPQPMLFRPVPPPPKKGFWSTGPGVVSIIAIVLGAIMVVCVGLVVTGMVSDRAAASEMNAEITKCEASGGSTLPTATVEFTVTNNGSSARGATVHLEYRDDAGNRIDTDTSYVKSVAPGDTVRQEETTLLNAPVSRLLCQITKVS